MPVKATLNVKELSKYLGVGLNTAYELVRQSDFPAIRVGEKRIIIPVEQLDEWLKVNAKMKII